MDYSSRPENVLLCIAALGSVLADLGATVDTHQAMARVHAALGR